MLSEYGPEGEGRWSSRHAGLGYRHLEVSPESCHEAQPVHHGPLVLVADALLDNRDELCDRLDISTGQRTTLPDSRLLLQAYLRWGSACVDRLHGDYAFVLWDDRAGHVFAARDPPVPARCSIPVVTSGSWWPRIFAPCWPSLTSPLHRTSRASPLTYSGR
ncbi:hypothetical protein [Halomonas sp. E19]|uniref:hypothetical protein n=1 Tax=Halomonas sp. E19 TaxID=3397247 RepID=UPI004033FA1B